MKDLMFWAMPAMVVSMMILMIAMAFISIDERVLMDNFCEETATVHIAKSCGFGCTDNYCVDKETGILDKILIVEGEVILVK